MISMHQKLGRLWRLQASDEREAESWVNILNQLLLARDGDEVNVKRLQQVSKLYATAILIIVNKGSMPALRFCVTGHKGA